MNRANHRAGPPTQQEERTANEPNPWPARFHLWVDCQTEENQQALYERLQAEGYNCRVLTM